MERLVEMKWFALILTGFATMLLIQPEVASADSPANVLAAWSDGTVELRNGTNGSQIWSTTISGNVGFTANGRWANTDLDLNGDGVSDILVKTQSSLVTINSITGAHLWDYNFGPGATFYNNGEVYVGNVDGSGSPSIIVSHTASDGSGAVYDFATNGTLNWSNQLLPSYLTTVADIDKDGHLEIIGRAGNGATVAADLVTKTQKWSYSPPSYNFTCAPCFADVLGDGRLVTYNTAYNGMISAVKPDGTTLWTHNYGGYEPNPVVTKQTDPNHKPTIAVGTCYGGGNNDVSLLDAATGDTIWTYSDNQSSWAIYPLGTTDVNGDGIGDVIAGAGSRLIALDGSDGILLWSKDGWAIDHRDGTGLTSIADVTGGSLGEILATGIDGISYGVLSPIDGSLLWSSTQAVTLSGVDFVTVSTPEPSTLVLLVIGAIGLLGYAWRRRIRMV